MVLPLRGPRPRPAGATRGDPHALLRLDAPLGAALTALLAALDAHL
ncbi:hypothetical protein [Thermobifida cellulosilytica]|nr:hypothetical protein [Thermobifida cellulosilytica]